MDKPVSVAIDELRQGVTYLVNNSGLPFCVTFLVLKDISIEAMQLANEELKQGNKEWNDFCDKQNGEEEA